MNYERGGVAFVGCIVLGVGIGMLFDNPGAGSLIGVGVGFLAMALFGKR
jgi:hypothetical protein